MASVYLCLVEPQAINEPHILMARKNFTGVWGDGGPAEVPFPWNSGGQWVLPGGRFAAPPTQVQSQPTEEERDAFRRAALAAVIREAFEELHLDLYRCGYICFPTTETVRWYLDPRLKFAVVYAPVASLHLLKEELDETLANRRVSHDELFCVEVMPLTQARESVGAVTLPDFSAPADPVAAWFNYSGPGELTRQVPGLAAMVEQRNLMVQKGAPVVEIRSVLLQIFNALTDYERAFFMRVLPKAGMPADWFASALANLPRF